MSRISQRLQGVLLGSRIRSDESSQALLSRRLATPLFTAGILSSVTYVPQFLLMALAVTGAATGTIGLWTGLVIVLVLALTVVAQYVVMKNYPGGGGDYQVAKHNLGYRTAATVASGFMVDYALTVALCLGMSVHMFSGVLPELMPYATWFVVLLLALVFLVALRGFSHSAWFTITPTIFFIGVLIALIVAGITEVAMGNSITAPSATYGLTPNKSFQNGFEAASIAAVLLVLSRAMGVGSAALSGVEAVNNGMGVLEKPKHKNASRILVIGSTVTTILFIGVIVLVWKTGAVYVQDPLRQLPGSPAGYVQQPLLVQLAEAVFKGSNAAIWIVITACFLILIVAALATFISFPALTMHLAKDGFLPHRLSYRGRRLTHDYGIYALAILVVIFVWITKGSPVKIMQLYAIGTLWSFSVTQLSMIKHWRRHLHAARTPAKANKAKRGLALAVSAFIVLSILFVCALVSKFLHGGWIAILAIVLSSVVLMSIGRHYAKVKQRLASARWQGVAPSRTHALVIVDGLHLPTRRTLAYARAAQPHVVEAITVNIDDANTSKLMEAWIKSELDLPLKVLESPYRTTAEPVIRYIRRLRAHSPRDVVNVYIPELVVSHWWESIAHNELLDQLRYRLIQEPGVSLTVVPFLLDSSEHDIEAQSYTQNDDVIVVSPETPEGKDGTR